MAIESGHKNDECDGQWIDVGTLTDPGKQVCSACRGHRLKPLVEAEDPAMDHVQAIMEVASKRHANGLDVLRRDLQALDPVVMDETTGEWWYFDSEPPYQFGPFKSEDEARVEMRGHLGIANVGGWSPYERIAYRLGFVLIVVACSGAAVIMVLGMAGKL